MKNEDFRVILYDAQSLVIRPEYPELGTSDVWIAGTRSSLEMLREAIAEALKARDGFAESELFWGDDGDGFSVYVAVKPVTLFKGKGE